MKNWLVKVLLSSIILLGGYGDLHAQVHTFSAHNSSSILLKKINYTSDLFSNKFHSTEFKKLSRKVCLLDNEENEEEFSSIQKQLVKNSYFVDFLFNNELAVFETTFTRKKVNYSKIFNLLSNKVYILFQVFRI